LIRVGDELCSGVKCGMQWSKAWDAVEQSVGCSGVKPGMQWSKAWDAVE